MIPVQFDYVAPTSVEEALAALAEHGDDAKVIAGGQSLLPVLRMRLNAPEVVVDLGGAAHFGSRGLTALLRTQDAAARRGTRLHVSTGGRRHIRRPLEITGIDAIVPVFATVADALAGSPLVRS